MYLGLWLNDWFQQGDRTYKVVRQPFNEQRVESVEIVKRLSDGVFQAGEPGGVEVREYIVSLLAFLKEAPFA